MGLPTLNVVGCGRVGQTLARLWQQHGICEVQDLHARSPGSAAQAARFVGAGRPADSLAAMRPAQLWMLSVPDTQVAGVAAALARLPLAAGAPAVAFHCSGFLAAAALAPLREHGWQLASVHPALNFASPETGVRQFPGTPCGLEGDAPAVERLGEIFTAIGGACFPLAGEHKPLYHAAAVLSSNFTVVLQALAREAWQRAGVPEALVPALNAALLRATVDNTLALGPAGAITGPAARGDTAVVERQAELLGQWDAGAGSAYRLLSAMARQLAVSGRAVGP